MNDKKQLESIVELLDDTDKVVIEELDRYILGQGEEIILPLASLISDRKNDKRKNAMMKHLKATNGELRISQLEKSLKTPGISVYELAYIVTASLDLTLTRAKFSEAYLPFISEMLTELSDDKTLLENISIFNHIFFRRLKFTPSDMFMVQQSTALLPEIFKTRKGNPIAISVIYFMLAQSCGLDLQPMCFPGGFIPVCMDNSHKVFYINMFDGGKLLGEDQLESFLGNHGFPISYNDFKVRDASTVILVYLESLIFYYSSIKDHTKEDMLERLANCFGDIRFLSMDEEDDF